MSELINHQFERLKERYEDAEIRWFPDGVGVITATVSTGSTEAWNKERTKVWVVIPVGYPIAKPDCFWTEPDLRLRSGAMPINTGFNPLPHHAGQFLWFSWHTSMWNPNKDNLLTYLHTVEDRLRKAQ